MLYFLACRLTALFCARTRRVMDAGSASRRWVYRRTWWSPGDSGSTSEYALANSV